MATSIELVLALVTPWLATALLLALRLAPVVFLVPVLGGRRIPATARTGALAALVLALAPGAGPTTGGVSAAQAGWQLLVGLGSGAAAVAWVAAVSAVGGVIDTAVSLTGVPGADGVTALGTALVSVTQASLTATVSLALPALMAGLLADLTLGWFNRAMPSLPAMFLAMPIRSVLGVLLAAALLGAAVDAGLDALPGAMDEVTGAVAP